MSSSSEKMVHKSSTLVVIVCVNDQLLCKLSSCIIMGQHRLLTAKNGDSDVLLVLGKGHDGNALLKIIQWGQEQRVIHILNLPGSNNMQMLIYWYNITLTCVIIWLPIYTCICFIDRVCRYLLSICNDWWQVRVEKNDSYAVFEDIYLFIFE